MKISKYIFIFLDICDLFSKSVVVMYTKTTQGNFHSFYCQSIKIFLLANQIIKYKLNSNRCPKFISLNKVHMVNLKWRFHSRANSCSSSNFTGVPIIMHMAYQEFVSLIGEEKREERKKDKDNQFILQGFRMEFRTKNSNKNPIS